MQTAYVNSYGHKGHGQLLDILRNPKITISKGLASEPLMRILLLDGWLVDGHGEIDPSLKESDLILGLSDEGYKKLFEDSFELLKNGGSFTVEYSLGKSIFKIEWKIHLGFFVEPKAEVSSEDEVFNFAVSKTWQEIKDLFQYHLIIHHRMKTNNFVKFLKGLGMIKATYYSNHLKLRGKGFIFPDLRKREKERPSGYDVQAILNFIEGLDDKSWKSANDKFEESVMKYFYEKNRFNKVNLAKDLGISYQAVRSKCAKYGLS